VNPSARFDDATVERWMNAAARRVSRRAYAPTPASAEALDALEDRCRAFRPFADARVEFVRDPTSDVFTGIIGSYGKITGAPHVLLFIGGASSESDLHVGYTGEAIVLEATALGLATCWVGGFFSARKARRMVDLAAGERILAVSPVGIALEDVSGQENLMRSLAHAKTRKPLVLIAPGSETWSDWAAHAAESARRAPSAMNRQPWRFAYDGDGLVLSLAPGFETPRVTKRLDCGIAMLHAELGARHAGCLGEWVESDGPQGELARFRCEMTR